MVGNAGSEVVDLVIRSMSNALSISISKHHLHSKVKVVTVAKVEFNLIAIIMESFSNIRITFVACILLLLSIVYTEYAEKECTCKGNWKKRKGWTKNGKRVEKEWTNYKTCR